MTQVVKFDQRTSVATMLRRRHLRRTGDGTYQVASRDGGARYRMATGNGTITCTCEGARYGRDCWHVAKVAAYVLRHGLIEEVIQER